MTSIYYESDADTGVLDGQRGCGGRVRQTRVARGRSTWREQAGTPRSSACARDETREASSGGWLRGSRRGGRERSPTSSASSCPTTSSRMFAARARAGGLMCDRRQRVHPRIRPVGSTRRPAEWSAPADARPRGTPLLRGNAWGFITGGRRAPRRHREGTRPPSSRLQGDRRVCARGALALTPMQEAVLDLGVEQVLSARVDSSEQRVCADDDRTRHPPSRRSSLSSCSPVRFEPHVPVCCARSATRAQSEFHSPTSQYGQLSRRGPLRPPRLRRDDARTRRRHRVGTVRPTSGMAERDAGISDAHAG